MWLAKGSMVESIREFGTRDASAQYVLRPGGYAVILREPQQIAVVTTPLGRFLPGGGQEHDETPDLAAIREVREECGLSVRILRAIGIADELIYASVERTHFCKRCTFFLAEVTGVMSPEQADHCLSWVSILDAAAYLHHRSQRWAVSEACRIMGVAS